MYFKTQDFIYLLYIKRNTTHKIAFFLATLFTKYNIHVYTNYMHVFQFVDSHTYTPFADASIVFKQT
jgi:hypothetical protein